MIYFAMLISLFFSVNGRSVKFNYNHLRVIRRLIIQTSVPYQNLRRFFFSNFFSKRFYRITEFVTSINFAKGIVKPLPNRYYIFLKKDDKIDFDQQRCLIRYIIVKIRKINFIIMGTKFYIMSRKEENFGKLSPSASWWVWGWAYFLEGGLTYLFFL